MPDSPVKYPVTKNNPNYLFCNFPWFGLVSIRIKSKVSLLNWPKCVFSEFLMYMNDFFAFLHKRIFFAFSQSYYYFLSFQKSFIICFQK